MHHRATLLSVGSQSGFKDIEQYKNMEQLSCSVRLYRLTGFSCLDGLLTYILSCCCCNCVPFAHIQGRCCDASHLCAQPVFSCHSVLSVVHKTFVSFQDEISVLPGWGSWAGQQKEPHWMKAANQKAQRCCATVSAAYMCQVANAFGCVILSLGHRSMYGIQCPACLCMTSLSTRFDRLVNSAIIMQSLPQAGLPVHATDCTTTAYTRA